MTFSSKAKNEISRLELEEECCLQAELSAIIRVNGDIKMSGINQMKLGFITENAAIARRIFSLIKFLYNSNIEVKIRRSNRLKKSNKYLIVVDNDKISRKIIGDLGFEISDSEIYYKNHSIPPKIIEDRCCKRSYIRGAFLGAGSVSNPEKDYHLEFVSDMEIHAEELKDLINSFGLKSKTIKRKDRYVTYLKEADQIADMLNIIGAHQVLLKFEDIRVLKNIRNNINRLVNCETANLSKTVDASMRQISNIEYIHETIGLNKLPKKLREVAEIRINNTELSLKEVGERLNPNVGKSGVNHRFRRIEKIAEDLRSGKEII